MVDRPILFSGPMIRALLEGRKTQTRRVVKPQPIMRDGEPVWPSGAKRPRGRGFEDCPYGQPGGLLWVREAWAHAGFCETTRDAKAIYRADGERQPGSCCGCAWKPSIFMPRWASRLTLRITDVRVERLTAISDDDIWAEGVQVPPPCSGPIVRSAFAVLWDSINGAGSFDANPWVWALTFDVIPHNVDSVLLELANAPIAALASTAADSRTAADPSTTGAA